MHTRRTEPFSSLKLHPQYEIVPEMRAEEFKTFVEDIRARGIRVPIEVDEHNVIIDGRSRYMAAKTLGIKDVPIVDVPLNGDDPVVYMIRAASKRRHLTDDQRACLAEEERRYMAAKNKVDRAETARAGKKPSVVLVTPTKTEAVNSRTQVAKQHQISEHKVREAGKLDQKTFEKVKRGEQTIIQAKREKREQAREEKRAVNAAKVEQVSKPEEIVQVGVKFPTIVIDPPWDWGDEGDINQLGRAKPDYATKSIEELMALPMPTLSDDDCHLYLWITNRSLPKGFRLLDAWGFRYITCLTWCKPSFGMGNYFRGSTEQILFAVKGSQALKRKDVGTWFQWDRGPRGHSSKPSEFFSLVESCSPGPYLEMYGREQRQGWTIWGENS